MKTRRGFTLIEIVVALAILFILLMMAFEGFAYSTQFSIMNKKKIETLDEISNVADQMVKELRSTITTDDGSGFYGVVYPDADSTRSIKDISSPDEPLNHNQYLKFGGNDTEDSDPKAPILEFYVMDSNGVKHRISYTLGVPPHHSGQYRGIPRKYWASDKFEPCEVLYSNETWDGTEWTGVQNQPLTDQVVTNLEVIRPSWSDKVIQIVIEAYVKAPQDLARRVYYTATVALRQ